MLKLKGYDMPRKRKTVARAAKHKRVRRRTKPAKKAAKRELQARRERALRRMKPAKLAAKRRLRVGESDGDKSRTAEQRPLLLTEREAAARLLMCKATLAKWRCEGGGPEFVIIGTKRVGYTEAALERWIAERQVSSTAEAKRVRARTAKPRRKRPPDGPSR